MPITITKSRLEILHYLSRPDHPERHKMLKDLDSRGIMSFQSDESFGVAVRDYLEKNDRNFCKDGIERFCHAFPYLTPPKPKKNGRLVVTLNIDLEDVPSGFGGSLTADNSITTKVTNTLKTHLADNIPRHDGGQTKVTKVDWISYTATAK